MESYFRQFQLKHRETYSHNMGHFNPILIQLLSARLYFIITKPPQLMRKWNTMKIFLFYGGTPEILNSKITFPFTANTLTPQFPAKYVLLSSSQARPHCGLGGRLKNGSVSAAVTPGSPKRLPTGPLTPPAITFDLELWRLWKMSSTPMKSQKKKLTHAAVW